VTYRYTVWPPMDQPETSFIDAVYRGPHHKKTHLAVITVNGKRKVVEYRDISKKIDGA